MLPENPVEVLGINDAHRRSDVGDADLWTADQIALFPTQIYRYQIPTLTPRVWPKAQRITQATYNADFLRRDPLAARVLAALNPEGAAPRVVVAGGAAAAPYYETRVTASDVDFFVVGLDGDQSEELWKLVRDFTQSFCEACLDNDEGVLADFLGGDPGELVYKLAMGVLTLTLQVRVRYKVYKARKYQLILRTYPSGSAVVHGFDVPACCTFYDGRTAWSSTLGAYAHFFRVNLVNPAYRSTTYEPRLVKYFKRHYALGFVHLAAGALQNKAQLQLPHLTITTQLVRGNRAVGSVKAAAAGAKTGSDYESVAVNPNPQDWPWTSEGVAHYATRFVNLAQLVSGTNRFISVRCSSGLFDNRCRDDDGNLEWFPPGGEAERPPTFAEIFSREVFEHAVRAVARETYDSTTPVRINSLCKYLGMSTAEVGIFTEKLQALIIENPGRKVVVTEALQPFKDQLVERYDAAAEAPIEWWIKTDPGRQHTASLNPRMENPAEWYGPELTAAEPGTASLNVLAQSLLAALEDESLSNGGSGPVYYGYCSLCLAPLARSAPNTIILPCGHVFHAVFYADSECRGLLHWMREHSDCPCCRKDFDLSVNSHLSDYDVSGVDECPPVHLHIDWPS